MKKQTGHRFQSINPIPYLRTGQKPPVVCAYCNKPAGHPSHNR